MVVLEVVAERSAEVTLVEDDDVVEALAAEEGGAERGEESEGDRDQWRGAAYPAAASGGPAFLHWPRVACNLRDCG